MQKKNYANGTLTKNNKFKIKKIVKQLNKSVKSHKKQSKVLSKIVKKK